MTKTIWILYPILFYLNFDSSQSIAYFSLKKTFSIIIMKFCVILNYLIVLTFDIHNCYLIKLAFISFSLVFLSHNYDLVSHNLDFVCHNSGPL